MFETCALVGQDNRVHSVKLPSGYELQPRDPETSPVSPSVSFSTC